MKTTFPVSYTHLDVYKRQYLCKACIINILNYYIVQHMTALSLLYHLVYIVFVIHRSYAYVTHEISYDIQLTLGIPLQVYFW